MKDEGNNESDSPEGGNEILNNPPKFGIIANTTKTHIGSVLNECLQWMDRRKIPFVVASDLASILDIRNWEQLPPEKIAEGCDLVLSFGGDGTFLQTARWIAPHEKPIVGVNLGGFGYLAEVKSEELFERINDLIAGNYTIQDRIMLEVAVPVQSGHAHFFAMNDVVIDKGGFPRTIRIETVIDEVYLNTFRADGLIVATPTGSTGYSLSTGGPIVEPSSDMLIINPICPHMLANRPLIITGDRIIEITVPDTPVTCQVAVDGQQVIGLKKLDRITIRKAPFFTRMAVFNDYDFYALLRNKLHWIS